VDGEGLEGNQLFLDWEGEVDELKAEAMLEWRSLMGSSEEMAVSDDG
jgi:hypothetical protein